MPIPIAFDMETGDPDDAALSARQLTPGMALVHQGMGVYLAKRRAGKAFHDPLAAAVALDESICAFREVEVYRERGAWGARPAAGTRTRISVSVDHARFLDVLTATASWPSGSGFPPQRRRVACSGTATCHLIANVHLLPG